MLRALLRSHAKSVITKTGQPIHRNPTTLTVNRRLNTVPTSYAQLVNMEMDNKSGVMRIAYSHFNRSSMSSTTHVERELREALRDVERVSPNMLILQANKFNVSNGPNQFTLPLSLRDINEALKYREEIMDIISRLKCATQANLHGHVEDSLELALAMATQLRVCTQDTTFQTPHCSPGLIPTPGSAVALSALVGPLRAALLMINGNTVSALDAQRMQLVDVIVDDEKELKQYIMFALSSYLQFKNKKLQDSSDLPSAFQKLREECHNQWLRNELLFVGEEDSDKIGAHVGSNVLSVILAAGKANMALLDMMESQLGLQDAVTKISSGLRCYLEYIASNDAKRARIVHQAMQQDPHSAEGHVMRLITHNKPLFYIDPNKVLRMSPQAENNDAEEEAEKISMRRFNMSA